jgi:hypothetical protein
MATLRRIGTLCLVSLTLALALGSGTAAGARTTRPGGSCGDGSISALNEYCEQIPAAPGGQTPALGSPALANGLAAARGMSASASPASHVTRAARRRLRSLPAPIRSRPIAGSISDPGILSQSLTLIFILIVLVIALGGLAYERRRRRRPA